MEFTINTQVIAEYKINPTQALLYCYIKSLSNLVKSETVTVVHKDVRDLFNLSYPTIQKAIDTLIEKGLVNIHKNTGRGITYQVLHYE